MGPDHRGRGQVYGGGGTSTEAPAGSWAGRNIEEHSEGSSISGCQKGRNSLAPTPRPSLEQHLPLPLFASPSRLFSSPCASGGDLTASVFFHFGPIAWISFPLYSVWQLATSPRPRTQLSQCLCVLARPRLAPLALSWPSTGRETLPLSHGWSPH